MNKQIKRVTRRRLNRKNCEEDTPELAKLVLEGMQGRYTKHRKGDIRKLLNRFRKLPEVIASQRINKRVGQLKKSSQRNELSEESVKDEGMSGEEIIPLTNLFP